MAAAAFNLILPYSALTAINVLKVLVVGLFVPFVSLSVRRAQDSAITHIWLVIGLVGLLLGGVFAVFTFFVLAALLITPSTDETNQYGPCQADKDQASSFDLMTFHERLTYVGKHDAFINALKLNNRPELLTILHSIGFSEVESVAQLKRILAEQFEKRKVLRERHFMEEIEEKLRANQLADAFDAAKSEGTADQARSILLRADISKGDAYQYMAKLNCD